MGNTGIFVKKHLYGWNIGRGRGWGGSAVQKTSKDGLTKQTLSWERTMKEKERKDKSDSHWVKWSGTLRFLRKGCGELFQHVIHGTTWSQVKRCLGSSISHHVTVLRTCVRAFPQHCGADALSSLFLWHKVSVHMFWIGRVTVSAQTQQYHGRWCSLAGKGSGQKSRSYTAPKFTMYHSHWAWFLSHSHVNPE